MMHYRIGFLHNKGFEIPVSDLKGLDIQQVLDEITACYWCQWPFIIEKVLE